MLKLTEHANRRCQQRAISGEALEAAWNWGRQRHLGQGRVALFLDERCVRKAQALGVAVRSYLNTLIILGSDNVVITAIRCSNWKKVGSRSRRKTLR